MRTAMLNAEGYKDPTPYEAMKRPRRFRPIVYICSAYAGDVETNTKNARRYCRYASDKGYIPFAPHLLFTQFLDDTDPEERSLALFFGSAMMSKCQEVWVFGRITSGMESEINHAARRYIRTRYFTEDMKEVGIIESN